MKDVRKQLKAERVQEPEAALVVMQAPGVALRAERVQFLLKGMPGWAVLPGGRALGRVREFAVSAHAEAFAGYVAKLSLTERLPITINLTPSQVIVTVHGQAADGCPAVLTDEVFALAGAIG